METGSKARKPNPYDSCSWVSRALFLWVLPLFRLGFSKDLDEDDVYECCRDDDPEKWSSRLET